MFLTLNITETPTNQKGQVCAIYQKGTDTYFKVWKSATVKCLNKWKCLGIPYSLHDLKGPPASSKTDFVALDEEKMVEIGYKDE